MKRLVLAFTVFGITATAVKAQSGEMQKPAFVRVLDILAEVSAAQSTTANYHLSVGADVQAELPVAKGLKITASGGYQNYQYKANYGAQGVVKSHASYIPLLAGAKISLSGKVYAHAQLGYSVSTESGGIGAFTYAPGIGTRFGKFDASVRYVGLSEKGGGSLGAVGFKLGYVL